MPLVVLGVCGGIAAYKSAELLRRLTESGHDVHVVPTASALRFVGEPTWSALSGHPVDPDVLAGADEVRHVSLARAADLVVVAPATADFLARAVAGRADDLLSALLLTARCPTVFAPAMHTEMWDHPATRANVATLRARGVVVLDPASGRLTGADSGVGRLPEPVEIAAVCRTVLARPPAGARSAAPGDLAGRHVVVTAGGTREFLDPVRFLGNRSSGRQGYALARTAALRGARVSVVAANVALPDPAGAQVVRVGTTAELREATLAAARGADAVVMAAAPADFAPAEFAPAKIKKGDRDPEPLVLVRTPDVLREVVSVRPAGQLVVGFAAETGDEHGTVAEHGRRKLADKGCDLLVVNQVGATQGFDRPDNTAVVLGADGSVVDVPLGSKEALADTVWSLLLDRW